jgi:CHAT domain-containing protein
LKMGDEVMGLVPALLFSGASSTISTLWSIANRARAAFSKYMFRSVFDQCEGRLSSSRQTLRKAQ